VNTRVGEIKKNQKESLLRKEIGVLLQETSLDYPELNGVSVSRVELSSDKGLARVFFFLPEGKDAFEQKLQTLKLFRKSLRKALATRIPGRYVPQIMFHYDDQLEKQIKIETLLDKVKKIDDNTET
jgi:ribosome-binding factor A